MKKVLAITVLAAAVTAAVYGVYPACLAYPGFGRLMEIAAGVVAAILTAMIILVLLVVAFSPQADDSEDELSGPVTSGSGAPEGDSGHAGARTGSA